MNNQPDPVTALRAAAAAAHSAHNNELAVRLTQQAEELANDIRVMRAAGVSEERIATFVKRTTENR